MFCQLLRKVLVAGAFVAGFSQCTPAQLDDWTIEHFQRARQAQRENKLETAADEYRLILTKTPKFAEVYLNLGIVYQLQNRYDDAIKAFESGLAVRPDLLGAQTLLGISYYMVQDFQAALQPLRQALKVNPKERQAGIYRALALLALDEPEKAAAQFRETSAYYPDDLEILYHLGEVYNEGVRQSAQLLLKTSRDSALYPWAFGIAAERKNDTASAIQQYLSALQIDPNISELYFRLVVLFEKAGVPWLSEEAARRLAFLSPCRAGQFKSPGQLPAAPPAKAAVADEKNNYQRLWEKLGAVRNEPATPPVADGFVNRAVQRRLAADRTGAFKAAFAVYQKGSFQPAAEKLKALVQQRPQDWVAAYLLARAYVNAGDYDAAEETLEKWLAPHFQVPSVALLRLEIQTEMALRYYNIVMSKKPDSVRARMLRAKSFAATLQPEKAVEEYKEVLKLQPDLPQVHLAIAQLCVDQLNWRVAIEELQKELELSPYNGMALALLGHAYAQNNDSDRAIEVLTKVLERYPKDANALADIGKAFASKGDKAKAIDALERAVLYDQAQYRLHYRLFQLYKSAGQQELARKHLEAFQAEGARRRKANVIADR